MTEIKLSLFTEQQQKCLSCLCKINDPSQHWASARDKKEADSHPALQKPTAHLKLASAQIGISLR